MTTNNREELKEHIRSWIRLENEISQLNAEIRRRKEAKTKLTESLVNVMKDNEIQCIDVTNGKLLYSKTKVKNPLNNAQMLSALIKYFHDDVETAKGLSQFLLSERTEKVKESIRMKIPKLPVSSTADIHCENP